MRRFFFLFFFLSFFFRYFRSFFFCTSLRPTHRGDEGPLLTSGGDDELEGEEEVGANVGRVVWLEGEQEGAGSTASLGVVTGEARPGEVSD